MAIDEGTHGQPFEGYVRGRFKDPPHKCRIQCKDWNSETAVAYAYCQKHGSTCEMAWMFKKMSKEEVKRKFGSSGMQKLASELRRLDNLHAVQIISNYEAFPTLRIISFS